MYMRELEYAANNTPNKRTVPADKRFYASVLAYILFCHYGSADVRGQHVDIGAAQAFVG